MIAAKLIQNINFLYMYVVNSLLTQSSTENSDSVKVIKLVEVYHKENVDD